MAKVNDMRDSIERLQVLEEVQRELAELRAEVSALIPLVEQRRVALSEITEACRSGDFYKDYDESCAIIRRCDEALSGTE